MYAITLLVIIVVLAFIALTFYPYLKLRSVRGKAIPASGDPLDEKLHHSPRMLVYFMAPQCGMCRKITPVIDELAEERDDVIRIDASEKTELARQFGVRGTPAFMLISQGVVEKVKLGAMSRKKILAMLEGSD